MDFFARDNTSPGSPSIKRTRHYNTESAKFDFIRVITELMLINEKESFDENMISRVKPPNLKYEFGISKQTKIFLRMYARSRDI